MTVNRTKAGSTPNFFPDLGSCVLCPLAIISGINSGYSCSQILIPMLAMASKESMHWRRGCRP